MTLSELDKWLQQLGGQIDTGVARKMGRTADAIAKELFRTTPVDTGRARSGWVVTLDSPSADLPASGHYPAPISTSVDVLTSRVSSGRTIYIVNNVPYIGILNQGWSRQAPARFVEASISRGVAATRGVRIL